MAPNKTDSNDADGLAHLAEVGFYREVRVKSFDSMLVRTLVAARHQMLKMTIQMSNQIRGLMKTFGLVVPKGAGSVFEGHMLAYRHMAPALGPPDMARHPLVIVEQQNGRGTGRERGCKDG